MSNDLNNTEEDNDIFITQPDPLPEEERVVTSGNMEEDGDAKLDESKLNSGSDKSAGLIPKPVPKGGGTRTTAGPEPMSSNTISIKRRPDERKEKESLEEEKERTIKIFCYNCEQKLDLTSLEPFSTVNCPSCQSEIIVPKWFDNYLLEEFGGRGGMATVYRALDLTLDREVAIKILAPDVASEAERKNLFLHEARTGATINHYGVLPIYTCGEYENQPYIVMQYMSGGSLDNILEDTNKRPPPNEIFKWIRDVAEGLDNARRHGIIHHDIKPGNIMLDADRNAKIGDFGISQALHDARSQKISKLTTSWASPHYVSPEKIVTGKEDYMGDIYSLGATFYHLLTGHTPFELDDVDELIRYRLENDPVDPRKHCPEIPQPISELVLAMMSRSPGLRPSYRDIITVLNSYLKKHGKKHKSEKKENKGNNKKRKKLFAGAKIKQKKLDSLFGHSGRKPNISILLLIHLLFWVLILGLGYYLWQNGYFDRYLSRILSRNTPDDCLPEATKLFSIGDSLNAASVAELVFNNEKADINAKKQSAIQLALAAYLNDDNGQAKNQCAIILERLVSAGMDENDSSLAIIQYLSNDGIPSQSLKARLENEEYLKLLGAMAVYLRNIYNHDSEIELLKSSGYYHYISEVLPPEYWGNAWKGRVPLWIEWMESGKGNPSQLEPLIVKNKLKIKPLPQQESNVRSHRTVPEREDFLEPDDNISEDFSSTNIDDLTAEWLEANRDFALNRPRPENYSFNEEELKSYLAGIPEDKRDGEKKRLQQITELKSYLCTLMMRMPYETNRIRLKNGKILQGGSVMANPNYLSLRAQGNRPRSRIEWLALSFEQYLDFFEYYTKIRINIESERKSSRSKQRLEGARDYLRLAILCDWYKHYPDAVKYAQKAASVDPRIKKDIRRYLLE